MGKTYRNLKHAKMFRNPRTFPEFRDSEACKCDGEFRKRPKREMRLLRDSYDDVYVAAFKEVPKNKLDKLT